MFGMCKVIVIGRIIAVLVFFIFGGTGLASTGLEGQPQAKEQPSYERVRYALTTCKGVSILPSSAKEVALTFDDGPSETYTRQILKILKENNIRGTFFFVGKNVAAYPQIVKEVYYSGSVIGNHTYSHSHLNRLNGDDIEQEITKNSALIKKTIGVSPLLFRPPYGACSNGSVRVAKNLNLKTIMWTAMVDDYHVDRTSAEKIASEILALVHPGAVIGLHDGGGNREKTVKALQIIITSLQKKGYEFVTIPELLGVTAYSLSDDE
jgi:peptidoglycan-N-acetylglucosamine deacetylase